MSADMQLPAELAGVDTMVFDVDGTLTNADHQVPPRVIESLRRLDAAGVRLVIASGRAPKSCEHTFTQAGLHGWISACNGAHVADIATGEVLRTRTVPAEMLAATLDVIEEADVPCSIMTAEDVLVNKDSFLTGFLEAANPGVEVEVADLRAVDPDTILKLMPAADKDTMAELFPRFKEIAPNASLSLDETCEVIGPGAEKADGVGFLIEHLGFDAQHIAGVGDGGNDVEWLKLVGWPIAMANAREEVKEIARLQIGHHLDEGVVEFVDAFLGLR
ncbi:HAD family hydrolase [Aestuariimicrobium sp. p3-SID1156]|uniref:HAD family hydrolase n=1 Tax=Aestuariimicrobium sp. p3-SID1156 TaxID=2916038 RepID=UPI00223AEB51|nr:HAD family hydrolase [Aestuariimicrobium sp. p3-SID1156]MCT1459354.1 HAD family hydrolase [Aestuariimicrobium sp. p3-SID1156]